MSRFEIQFESEALHGTGDLALFLPDRPEKKYKVLWYLHGAFSEYAEFTDPSSIVRYAADRGMAVVAPSSYMGVYTDMVYGENGYSFVKELLQKVPKLFPVLSTDPADNYLMGVSMGGYGTFKLAAEMPERFAGAAAFSSPVDMVFTMGLLESGNHHGGHELFDAFGSSAHAKETVNDTVWMLKKDLAAGKTLPRFSLCWGGDDVQAGMEDTRIRGIFEELGIPLYSRIVPGGDHSFRTWDTLFPEVLDYMLGGEK